MLVVIALGRHALLERNAGVVAHTIAPLASAHRVVIVHGAAASGVSALEPELRALMPFDCSFAAVPSLDAAPIARLLEHDAIVLAAGDSGADGDADAEQLARALAADTFVVLTDVDAVYANWGRPFEAAIRRGSPGAFARLDFAAASMAPKVAAACRFASVTGRPAAIGTLVELDKILAGQAGTTISAAAAGLAFAPIVRSARAAHS
jgi:carbamate kinase